MKKCSLIIVISIFVQSLSLGAYGDHESNKEALEDLEYFKNYDPKTSLWNRRGGLFPYISSEERGPENYLKPYTFFPPVHRLDYRAPNSKFFPATGNGEQENKKQGLKAEQRERSPFLQSRRTPLHLFIAAYKSKLSRSKRDVGLGRSHVVRRAAPKGKPKAKPKKKQPARARKPVARRPAKGGKKVVRKRPLRAQKGKKAAPKKKVSRVAKPKPRKTKPKPKAKRPAGRAKPKPKPKPRVAKKNRRSH